MSIFRYKGRDEKGKRSRGWIEAENPKAARQALANRGILTESLAENRHPGRFDSLERARLYRETGVMLQAGFNVEESLAMLDDSALPQSKREPLLLGLLQSIRQGMSLSAAISHAAPQLPAYEQATLSAAEQSGVQGDMLVQLADFIESQQAIQSRLRAALVYPVFVLTLALGLLGLMLLVVLPRASRLFDEFGAVPGAAGWIALWGPRLMLLVLIIFAAALITAVSLRIRAFNNKNLAVRLERMVLRLPAARQVLVPLWSLRFARTMALLMRAGAAPQELVSIAGVATGSGWIAQDSMEQCEKVFHGASLATAIGAINSLEPDIAAWVRVGEASGALHSMFDQLADRCQLKYERALAKLLSLLEPALIIIVGGIVLIVSYTVLKPMLSMVRAAANV